LSTNLAVGLASRNATGVALIDLDLKFGDAAYALMLAPQYTMLDAVSALPDLTSTQLKVYLTSHSSGLFTLCAPDEPAEGDGIRAVDTAEVIKLASSLFGYVVIDTGAGLDEHTLTAIELATDLIVVSDMDVPSVRNVRKALDTLDLLGLNDHRSIFVLNRANSRVGIKKEDVETAASPPIDLEIPSARAVPQSLNEGRPVILSNPRSPVSRKIMLLVSELLSAGMAPAAPREKEVDDGKAQ
jgi:pilus assembly protein CpaE